MTKFTLSFIAGFMFVIAIVLFAGSAKADNFDNTAYTVVASSDTLDFKIKANATDGLVGISAGLSVLPYTIGQVDANLYVELGYNRLDETLALDAEYRVSTNIGDRILVNGALGTTYIVDAGSNVGSTWLVNPYIGASYDVNRKLTAFAEVGNTWNASNSWVNEGGYAQVGVSYSVTDTVYVKPSVIRTFDTGNDSTQAALEVGFTF